MPSLYQVKVQCQATSSIVCAFGTQMVLAILHYLAPRERPSDPDTEQEKGFVSILRHAGFHGNSSTPVFESTCASLHWQVVGQCMCSWAHRVRSVSTLMTDTRYP